MFTVIAPVLGMAVVVIITRFVLNRVEKGNATRNLGPGKNKVNRWLYWPQIIIVAIALIVFVAISFNGFQEPWLGTTLRHLQHLDNAVFYNPAPGIYILTLVLAFSAFLLVLAIGCLLMLLLPQKLRRYNGITPRVVRDMFILAAVIMTLMSPGVFMGLHAHQVLTDSQIISNGPLSTYTFSVTAKDSIVRANARCYVLKHNKQETLHTEFSLVTKHNTVLQLVDETNADLLAMRQFHTSEAQHLRSWINERNIPVTTQVSPGCSNAIRQLPANERVEHDALFGAPSSGYLPLVKLR